ncbi:MAG TPA: ribonuclease III domain-containing protein [Anaerolineae bacterium]|nr:ribonuclease III domain-containing protein [Anaerolineae bacterium]HQI83356.1 ribonuclease III domain-containing protein [Anaerolineae bacterium]
MNPTLTHELQQRLGYYFANPDLLRLALTHSSAGVQNYERLEHLGDAVLELAVTYWLYRDFPHFGPGQMSILRAELVRAESLARFARQLELPWAVQLSLRADSRGLRQRTTVLSDVFEAVLGAVFVDTALDGGNADLTTVQTVLHPLVTPLADTVIHRNPGFYRVPSTELVLKPLPP